MYFKTGSRQGKEDFWAEPRMRKGRELTSLFEENTDVFFDATAKGEVRLGEGFAGQLGETTKVLKSSCVVENNDDVVANNLLRRGCHKEDHKRCQRGI